MWLLKTSVFSLRLIMVVQKITLWLIAANVCFLPVVPHSGRHPSPVKNHPGQIVPPYFVCFLPVDPHSGRHLHGQLQR